MKLNDWLPSKDIQDLARIFLVMVVGSALLSLVLVYYPVLFYAAPVIFVVLLFWAVLAPTKKV